MSIYNKLEYVILEMYLTKFLIMLPVRLDDAFAIETNTSRMST